jgi:glycosyltransferase involved in cell wall biosynthesis
MIISGVVIACNEETKIEACLRSLLKVSDQVVVLDSGSSDRTVELARSLGAEVHFQTFKGHIQQKNSVVNLAKHNWVLSLDADEVLSDELIAAIQAMDAPASTTAFRIKRLNNYCGQWIRYGAWYPDRKIRLWHKEYGTWGGRNPHDEVKVREGVAVVDIPGNILHYSYDNPEDLGIQCEKFADIARGEMHKSGAKRWRLPLIRALFKFCRDYFLKLGMLDGKAGLIIAFHNARYTYLKYTTTAHLKGRLNT